MKRLLAVLSIFLSFAQAQSATYPDEPDLYYDSVEVVMTEVEAYFDSIGVEYPLTYIYEYLDNGEYDSLHAAAEKVLSIFPNDVEARYCRAYASIYRGEWNNVVDDMVFAWENNGMGVDGYPTPLEMLYFIKNHKPVELFDAVSQIEEKLTKSQNDKEMLCDADMLLGHICGKLGTWGTASKLYIPKAVALAEFLAKDVVSAAIPIIEPFIQASNLQALGWLNSGHPDKALEALEHPLWDSIPEIERFHNRVIALRNLGRIEEALNYHDIMLKENPDDPYIIVSKGSYLIFVKEYDRAIECFNKAIELTDSIKRHTLNYSILGSSFLIKAHDCSLEALLRRGIARELKGDQNGAKEDYETVADQDKDGGFRLCALARLGRKNEAEDMLKRANPIELTLAMVYSQLREDDKALDHLGKAFYNQEVAPQAIPYDPNLWRLIDHPRYKEAVAKFNPSK